MTSTDRKTDPVVRPAGDDLVTGPAGAPHRLRGVVLLPVLAVGLVVALVVNLGVGAS